MDYTSSANKSMKKYLLILVISVIVVLVSAMIYFGWLALNYTDCGQKETMLPIPASVSNTQIMFDIPVYYEIGNPDEQTPTFQSIGREIAPDTSTNQYYPGRFKYEPVSTSTLFSVVGAVNNANCGLSSIDSGSSGVDFLILQDPEGNKSLIAEFELWASQTHQENHVASYYKNGKRVGYITSTMLPLIK
jgi:hypothetical protein